jgi:hypothetical protein
MGEKEEINRKGKRKRRICREDWKERRRKQK